MSLAALAILVWASAASQSTIAVHARAPGNHVEPTAAFSSAGLVVAWVVRRPNASEVLVAISPDLESFSAPLSLSGVSASTELVRPHVAAAGDKVAIVWADASHGDHDVYLAVSSDGGRTFSRPALAAGGPGGQLDPRVVIGPGEGVSLAFHDSFGSTGGDNHVVWRARSLTSRDGITFGGGIALGAPARDRHDLFAASAGRGTPESPLAVAWLAEPTSGGPNQVLIAESIDGGMSFGAEARVDLPGVRSMRPRIAATARGFVVAFDALLPAADQRADQIALEEGEYLDVVAATSISAGRSFSRPFVANVTRTLHQYRVDVAASGERVVLAWVDHSKPGIRRIVARASLDGGETFSMERVLAAASPMSEVDHPSVAVRSDVAVVVFEDATGGAFDVLAAVLR